MPVGEENFIFENEPIRHAQVLQHHLSLGGFYLCALLLEALVVCLVFYSVHCKELIEKLAKDVFLNSRADVCNQRLSLVLAEVVFRLEGVHCVVDLEADAFEGLREHVGGLAHGPILLVETRNVVSYSLAESVLV